LDLVKVDKKVVLKEFQMVERKAAKLAVLWGI
jgi:hypothetical protein